MSGGAGYVLTSSAFKALMHSDRGCLSTHGDRTMTKRETFLDMKSPEDTAIGACMARTEAKFVAAVDDSGSPLFSPINVAEEPPHWYYRLTYPLPTLRACCSPDLVITHYVSSSRQMRQLQEAMVRGERLLEAALNVQGASVTVID